MKTSKNNLKIPRAVCYLSVASLITAFVLMPATGSAGLKDRVQETRGKVTELKNKVQVKAETIQEKIEELDGEGKEQLMEMVTSMLKFVKHAQAGYKNFVGADKCGAGSPCGAFREQLRQMFLTFVNLPHDLPFVESIPPAVKQLKQFAQLLDHMPPPILYVTEKVLGNMFDEIQYRLEVVRYASAKLPTIPKMSELSYLTASSQLGQQEYPFCKAVLETGKPHVELLLTSIKALHETISDIKSVLPNEQTVGITVMGGGTISIKHPAKGGADMIVVLIKAIERGLTLRLALTKSVCAVAGYNASAN